MKKLISLLLILILLLSSMTFLASCNEDKPPKESSSESETESIEKAELPEWFKSDEKPTWLTDEDSALLDEMLCFGTWDMMLGLSAVAPIHMTSRINIEEAQKLVDSNPHYQEIIKKENAVDLLLWKCRDIMKNPPQNYEFYDGGVIITFYYLYGTDYYTERMTEEQKAAAKEIWREWNELHPIFKEIYKLEETEA